VWQEIITPMTLAFSYEVVHENENPSVFVKVMVKNQWHLFYVYVDTVYNAE